MAKFIKQEKTNNQDTDVSDKAVIGSIETSPNKKRSHTSAKLLLITCVVLLMLLFGWFVLRNDTFAKTVCGEDVVNSYNTLASYELRSDSDEPTVDIEELNALAADITSKKGYQSDPTCQTILLEVALFNKDYNTALEALNEIEELQNKNEYADKNITRITSLEEYKVFVRQITPSTSKEPQEPQGGE